MFAIKCCGDQSGTKRLPCAWLLIGHRSILPQLIAYMQS